MRTYLKRYLYFPVLALAILGWNAGYAQLRIGKPAPALTDIYPVSGSIMDSIALLPMDPARLTVIVFSGTQCIPCVKAIPTLVALAERYPEQLDILAIYAFEGDYRPDGRLQVNRNILAHYDTAKQPANYRLFVSPSPLEMASRWHVQGIPTFVVVDTSGNVVHRSNQVEEVAYLSGYFLPD